MQSLPLFEALPTPEEMRLWDQAAETRFGLSSFLLMENAAREAFAVLNENFPLCAGLQALVVMGGGNNGGDGAALARRLQETGLRVQMVCAKPEDALRGATAGHMLSAKVCGVSFAPAADFPPETWGRPDLVVDALTGTGIKGDLRDAELALVRGINALKEHAFVFSLDIPSGLCGYTGKPRPEAVRADLSVTFEAGKPGLFFPEAAPYTGRVAVRAIGIPLGAREVAPPSWRLIAPQPGPAFIPSPLRHKGQGGRVLIVGGSAGMAGAPVLAGLGALRAGAGLVHLAFPGGLTPPCPHPELMLHGLGDGTTWNAAGAGSLPELLHRLSPGAVVLGPGLGRNVGARTVVKNLLGLEDRPPVILDADALSFFHLPDVRPEAQKARQAEDLPLSLLQENDILTPHPGEMASLLPCSFFPGLAGRPIQDAAGLKVCIGELQEDRAGAMRAFFRQSPTVLTLKGPGTLVGRRGAPIGLCPVASSALGTAGSGDVLAGVIAALAAAELPSLEAACLGVYLHARAGQLLERSAPLGHLASEIAGAVPTARAELCRKAERHFEVVPCV